ncbi:MAG: biotin transporter BioY [Dehalococcoidia bacterium]|nr:biotin transporter BioY [Dehalococcoidia bacterium]
MSISIARPRTLSQAVIPQTGIAREMAVVLAASLVIAASAQVSLLLPFTPVPITGQTFGVVLTAAVLGRNRGVMAVLAYLAEGLAGLPVFSGGLNAWSATRAGVPVIVGPTAGFLVGFILAALVVGWLAERQWDRSILRTGAAMLAGNVALYVPGMLVLGSFVGFDRVLALGLLPFIPGDIIKIVLAMAALPGAWAMVRRAGSASP